MKDQTKELYENALEILKGICTNYRESPEFKTLVMNLTTVAKELNNIRIREITGTDQTN